MIQSRRSSFLLAVFLLSGALCRTSLAAVPQGEEQLVVADVQFAHAPRGQYGFNWFGPTQSWDHTGDGLPDFVFRGAYSNTKQFGFRPDAEVHLLRAGDTKQLWSKRYNRFTSTLDNPKNRRQAIVLLNPTGTYSVTESNDGQAFGIWRWRDQSMKWVKIPEAPIAGTLAYGITEFLNTGDVDGDGFMDFGCTFTGVDGQGIPYYARSVISGKTVEPLWVVTKPAETGDGFYFDLLGLFDGFSRATDSDGDGYLDILLQDGNWGTSFFSLEMLSGRTGVPLWRIDLPRVPSSGSSAWTSAGVVPISDVDSDGLIDYLAIANPDRAALIPGYLRLLSGRDGSTIWETNELAFDMDFASGQSSMWSAGRPSVIGDMDGDGHPEIGYLFKWARASHGGLEDQVFVFGGADGSLVARLSTAMTEFLPWRSRPFKVGISNAIGDMNGDGFSDFVVGLHSELGLGIDASTLSIATLETPRSALAGASLDYSIRIPSSPGHSFQLMASSTFVGRNPGQLKLGHWQTQLGVDVTSRLFELDPNMSGTLDSRGRFQGSVHIPINAGLEGTTVYFRGAIFEQSGKARIRTMTSISVCDVLP